MRDRLFLHTLEQSKEADVLVVDRYVNVVSYGGDPTDNVFSAAREKQLDLRVLMKWMLCRIDQLLDIPPQRWNPVGIASIKPERQLYELAPIALGPDWIDAKL